MSTPLPTPELVAALANQFIDELHAAFGSDGVDAMRRGLPVDGVDAESIKRCVDLAFKAVVGEPATSARAETMRMTAIGMARTLGYPAPYEAIVTLACGTRLPPQRCTITHFVDGEGFEAADWAAISALEVGEAYIVAGRSATMTVTRAE